MHTVALPDIDEATLEVLLCFIYTNQLCVPYPCDGADKLTGILTALKELGLDVSLLDGCRVEYKRYRPLEKFNSICDRA